MPAACSEYEVLLTHSRKVRSLVRAFGDYRVIICGAGRARIRSTRHRFRLTKSGGRYRGEGTAPPRIRVASSSTTRRPRSRSGAVGHCKAFSSRGKFHVESTFRSRLKLSCGPNNGAMTSFPSGTSRLYGTLVSVLIELSSSYLNGSRCRLSHIRWGQVNVGA